MLSEQLGEVYDSYNNSEKYRYVCRPSRERGIHDGFDRTKQAVKMADVFGVKNFGVASTSRIDPMATLKQSEVSCH